jgi:hypothetical protein
MKSVIGAATAAVFAAVSLSGCASIISGTSQEIKVVTNPPGANCELIREGAVIARVYQTPGGATIQKTKDDITLACAKAGYQEASYVNHSGIDGATFGKMVLGGAVGWGVDSAVGADNRYDSIVNVSMVPAPPTQVAGIGNASIGKPAVRSLCTPEDLALANQAQQNNSSVRLVCN